jgi:Methyltransferase domain
MTDTATPAADPDHGQGHSHGHGHYHHHDSASGERFVPELMGGEILEAEHQARYRLALPHVSGRRVLDAGCGVGWGSKLLLESGARTVTGLDISEEALADARVRAPGVELVHGDLQALPFPDASFDVVVCFEALEHAEDVFATLDGLVRVLAPEGVLFVSSPNPAVYPEGNPFHPSEMTPAELESAVAARLPELRMFHQHEQAVSVVAPALNGSDTLDVRLFSLTGLAPGHDPYSVAVASRVALPDVAAVACTSPPTELKRLTTERVSVMDQLDGTHAQLRDADVALRGVMAERDQANDRVAELITQSDALRTQLDNQRAVADNAARERDDLAMSLISQDRPTRPAAPAASPAAGAPDAETEKLRRQLRKARARVRALEAELETAQSSGLISRVKRRLPGS